MKGAYQHTFKIVRHTHKSLFPKVIPSNALTSWRCVLACFACPGGRWATLPAPELSNRSECKAIQHAKTWIRATRPITIKTWKSSEAACSRACGENAASNNNNIRKKNVCKYLQAIHHICSFVHAALTTPWLNVLYALDGGRCLVRKREEQWIGGKEEWKKEI